MRPTLLAAALLAAAALPLRAQAPVRYEISFPNRAHHEAEVTAVFPEVGPGPLELRMSRTSPGRYALHEFAKNVYRFRASGREERDVTVVRPDLHQWNVEGHGGEVRVRYTLYGDHADGTYTGIDTSHGHLNMPATFLWARGLEARPIELVVRVPEGSGWRVATQLVPTDDPHRFTAPDLEYFLDSPTEVSAFREISWEVEGSGGPATIRVALHHEGSGEEAEAYARGVRAIVAAEGAVFGTFPRFDHGTYTFLACYLPWVFGDGMEHRNSTVLTSSASLERAGERLLGTVAHEFFHAWNMERIRSAELEPFDFEHANMSRALWFGEGFTSYYTDVALWRAGILDDAAFAESVGRTVDAVVNAPGRRYFSPVEMSMQAPFVDAAVSVDETNRENTFLSYYTWGAGIGLGLDLTLRTRFSGVGLDDFMREMWRAHGAPAIPYTLEDLEAALARVTGDEDFARDFFDRYVRGSEVVDYAGLLAAAGIRLGPEAPGRALLGRAALAPGPGGAVVSGATVVGTPLYEAGVDRGDLIVQMGGRRIGGPADVEEVLRSHDPGETLELRWRGRGEERRATVTLAADPSLAAALDTSAPPAAIRLREAWKEGAR